MDASARSALESHHRESMAAIASQAKHFDTLLAIADRLGHCVQAGGTIYLRGNGGSAADAQDVAAEFVGRVLQERRPLPAIALSCNTSALTAIVNSYGFEYMFARQVRSHVTSRAA